jgi:NAD(P)-dependent dehydrogenase (short-subunit alcohol dehydrogenase family)
MELINKVALITGSAKRIGKAMALCLAREGCHIVVHHNHSAGLARQTAVELGDIGVKAWTITADLNSPQQAQSLIPTVLDQAGRLDILINNAAIFPAENFQNTTAESWDRNMAVNLKAPFLLSQSFAQHLPAERPGKIINMLDATAMRPRNHHFAYTISKYALQGLTKATAHALGNQNVQVNGIALGAILPDTPADVELFQKMTKKIPAGTTGALHDVTLALRYLIRDGDYITGEVITIDGGRHLI